jgi:hypothetical protein
MSPRLSQWAIFLGVCVGMPVIFYAFVAGGVVTLPGAVYFPVWATLAGGAYQEPNSWAFALVFLLPTVGQGWLLYWLAGRAGRLLQRLPAGLQIAVTLLLTSGLASISAAPIFFVGVPGEPTKTNIWEVYRHWFFPARSLWPDPGPPRIEVERVHGFEISSPVLLDYAATKIAADRARAAIRELIDPAALRAADPADHRLPGFNWSVLIELTAAAEHLGFTPYYDWMNDPWLRPGALVRRSADGRLEVVLEAVPDPGLRIKREDAAQAFRSVAVTPDIDLECGQTEIETARLSSIDLRRHAAAIRSASGTREPLYVITAELVCHRLAVNVHGAALRPVSDHVGLGVKLGSISIVR